jgi:hypothetical protein
MSRVPLVFARLALSVGVVCIAAFRARAAVPAPSASPFTAGVEYNANFTNEMSRENVVSLSENWPGGTFHVGGSGIPIPGQDFPRGVEQSILLIAHHGASLVATLSNGAKVHGVLNDPRLCSSDGCNYVISDYKRGFHIVWHP